MTTTIGKIPPKPAVVLKADDAIPNDLAAKMHLNNRRRNDSKAGNATDEIRRNVVSFHTTKQEGRISIRGGRALTKIQRSTWSWFI